MRCETCAFYWPIMKNKKVINYGECRRFPRAPIAPTDGNDVGWSTYPIQPKEDWCGEYTDGHRKGEQKN